MTDRFSVPPQVHARRFDDEVVVLDLKAGKYFALDAVGAAIWDQLTLGKSLDETVATLISAYEVDEGTARADVQRLADELLAESLLQRQR